MPKKKTTKKAAKKVVKKAVKKERRIIGYGHDEDTGRPYPLYEIF